MELTGEVAIAAARPVVWAALNDAATLQACIPGCDEVVDESPEVRRVRLMVKMGPVRARFSGRVTLSDVMAPERCVMNFEGSGGAAGMASGRSQVELMDTDGGTRLTYTVKASVGGKLGQIGGRMMDASAKQLADQFFAALQAHIAPVADAADAPDTAHATDATDAVSAVNAANTTKLIALGGDSISSSGTFASQNGVAAAATGASTPAINSPLKTNESARRATANSHAPDDLPFAQRYPELQRVLWFVLGAACTGFGVWLGRHVT